MKNKKVLVTGVTGFLGSHIAIQLLNEGYEVIGTLRSMKRADFIKSIIAKYTSNIHRLTLVEANLKDENIWYKVMEGVDYVQHIASPFPRKLPKNEKELIIPAVEGTLNILKAASVNKIKRVVMTSSTGSVMYGKTKEQLKNVFTEHDWSNSDTNKDITPYFKSKTMAEKAAWKFMQHDNSGMQLTTILPGLILGPVLENDFGTSANMILKIMDNNTPALPKIGYDVVDVRSVAELHIKAMESPNAAGQRFIASSGYITFKDAAIILKKKYFHRSIPTIELPNMMVRFYSNFDKSLKPILVDLGIKRKLDASKAQKILDWKPLPSEEAVISCAESLFTNWILN